ADPVGVYVDTKGTAKVKSTDGSIMPDGQIARKIQEIFDLRPFAIVERFGLKNPIFESTASYGHFGRTPYKQEVEVKYQDNGTFVKNINGEDKFFKTVEFFAWEKLDYVDKIKEMFA
ncbi:MAG: methionine adenosyltransferase domain-containing protein, partial [Hyphomicrobiales bacterium]